MIEILRIFLGLGTILGLALLAGCGRELPPSCRDTIMSTDTGRFQFLETGIAFDPEFGIDWYRCSVGERFLNGRCMGNALVQRWEDSVDTLDAMNEKADSRWRLPTLEELSSLRVEDCGNPSVNINVFPSIQVENYWASDESPHYGFRCGMYTYSGATSCRLFDNLERPFLMVRAGRAE